MTLHESRLPRKLSARFKNDFAFYTVKERLPVTLTKVIDTLSRNQKQFREKYGEEMGESVKSVIGCFSETKSNLQTNKNFHPIDDDFPDAQAWNERLTVPLCLENPISEADKKCPDYLDVKRDEPSWFNSSWLLTECYFYRRIASVFMKSRCLSDHDPFGEQKRSLLEDSMPGVEALGLLLLSGIRQTTMTSKKDLFLSLMKASLWANRWDLSLFSADELQGSESITDNLEKITGNVLRDDSEEIWKALVDSDLSRVDVVLDNSGLELFSDMVLGDFLSTALGVEEVVFHCKAMPWFVSDVTERDWNWTLDRLSRGKNPALAELSTRWSDLLARKKWHLRGSEFWTLPDAFDTMSKVDPNLYNDLASSRLVIFKGDLNYRKLTGDRKWLPSGTSFRASLSGFGPSPLCAVRTLKSDTLVGVSEEVVARASATDGDWMVSGFNGVIQFCGGL